MDRVHSSLDLIGDTREGPIVLARPHRVAAAATWFRTNFPGEVFYAVKANPSPWVLDALWANGVKGLTCFRREAALVASASRRADRLHAPVKSRRAIGRAYLSMA